MMMKKKLFFLIFILIIGGLFSFQSRFFEIAKQLEIYNNLFKELNINYIDEINPAELTDKAIKSTLKNLDPYTNFYNEQDVETARIRREGEYGGLGIAIFNNKKGLVISEVYQGFSGDKAGLKIGDIITWVDGQKLAELPKKQRSQTLKGTPNKELSLRIDTNNKTQEIKLKLDKVILNPVPFYSMINSETGYIVLRKFTNQKATEQVRNAFKELKEKGMKKLIFDLRNNPGGSLYDAVNITNLFIPKGLKVVDTRGKIEKNTRTYNTNQQPLDTQIPLVVLINDRSASASEIVSGALQDYDRAVIMGERSFGKGLVQRYFKLNYGTQMKATISKYYTPSGRCIQELDYANRNVKTGKIPKFSETATHIFTTKNGRKVYDGGGVTPDIKTGFAKKSAETKKLLQSKAIFNFVTDFIQKKSTSKNLDFKNFEKYLLTIDTSFVTTPEKLFKKAYTSVKNNTTISTTYNSITQQLKADKIEKIRDNQDFLSKEIQKELIKRNAYQQGVFKQQLHTDTTIEKAVKLLDNQKKYQHILAK